VSGQAALDRLGVLDDPDDLFDLLWRKRGVRPPVFLKVKASGPLRL
jgi:hypothetical protein